MLQRLESIGPARQALAAAMARQPPSRAELQAALNSCKTARSLLDAAVMAEAEVMLERATQQEEQDRWNRMADALTWQVRQQAAAATSGGSAAAAAQSLLGLGANAVLSDDALDAETECVVCLSEAKSTCCVPCGHVCMCPGCAADVQSKKGSCPVCRAPIECVLEIL